MQYIIDYIEVRDDDNKIFEVSWRHKYYEDRGYWQVTYYSKNGDSELGRSETLRDELWRQIEIIQKRKGK